MTAEHETPENDHTPAPAKALSIGLLAWCLFGGLILIGLYVVLRH
jgi:hypothetical protein